MKKLSLIVLALVLAGCMPAQEAVVDGESEGLEALDQVEVVDDSVYTNEVFDFSVKKIEGYGFEELPSGNGIVLTKHVVIQKEKDDEMQDFPYRVEIVVSGVENVLNYDGIAEMVADRYSGFQTEFDARGIYVNEGMGENAVRHYFLMSGGDFVEASMKIPSFVYNEYKGEFDQLVEGIILF